MIRYNSQRGAILLPFILAASSFCVVMGGIVESTLMLHARNRMFNDAESALLASANLYAENQDEAELNNIMKTQYANSNFLDATATNLDFSLIGDGILLINTSKSIPFLFLPDDLSVTANLAATVPQPAGSVIGAAPLAVEDPVGGFDIGVEYVIKDGGGAGYNGNYGALSLSGSGASDYENDLTYGYDGTISVGDLLTTKPGNMNGPTSDAIEYRLGTPSPDDDVLIVIITDDTPQGRDTITVKGFAAFRVTGVTKKGAITGEFIAYKTSADPATTPVDCDYCVYTRAKLTYH